MATSPTGATSPEESRLPPGSLVRQFVGEIRTIPQAQEILLHTLLPPRFLEIPDRMDEMQASMDGMQASIETMQAGMDGMQASLGGMQGSVNTLQGQVGNLRGESYERECARRIKMVMVEHLSNVIQADRSRIDELLVTARQNGRLTRAQFDQGSVIDIIAQGVPIGGGPELLAVVEVSISINEQDVRNAQQRAALLQELTGRTARPFCVAHYPWSAALASRADELGVTLIHYELPHFSDGSQC